MHNHSSLGHFRNASRYNTPFCQTQVIVKEKREKKKEKFIPFYLCSNLESRTRRRHWRSPAWDRLMSRTYQPKLENRKISKKEQTQRLFFPHKPIIVLPFLAVWKPPRSTPSHSRYHMGFARIQHQLHTASCYRPLRPRRRRAFRTPRRLPCRPWNNQPGRGS